MQVSPESLVRTSIGRRKFSHFPQVSLCILRPILHHQISPSEKYISDSIFSRFFFCSFHESKSFCIIIVLSRLSPPAHPPDSPHPVNPIYLQYTHYRIYCTYKCPRAPHSTSVEEIISDPLKYISQRIFLSSFQRSKSFWYGFCIRFS